MNTRRTWTGAIGLAIGAPYDGGMAEESRRVLVVDDEPTIRDVVTRYLERDGFRVTAAGTGPEALAAIGDVRPDLIVLDLMLPGISGIEILGEVRKSSDVPIIVLTARADETDRVTGLELGADDYVVKPFSPRELAARVRSVLRRAAPTPPAERPVMTFDDLVIDPAAREVRLAGDIVDLTAREFDLLAFLAASPRQVFSRAQLLHHVWDSSPDWQDPSTVTVHVRRLRNKLERDAEHPQRLITVRGVGYRFEP